MTNYLCPCCNRVYIIDTAGEFKDFKLIFIGKPYPNIIYRKEYCSETCKRVNNINLLYLEHYNPKSIKKD